MFKILRKSIKSIKKEINCKMQEWRGSIRWAAFLALCSGIVVCNGDDELESYFTDLDSKSTPLYKCIGGTDGIKWRLPKPLECQLAADAPKETKTVGITVIFPDITGQTVKGYECIGENKTRDTYKGPFFAFWESDIETTYFQISPEKCWKMIQTHMVHDDTPGSNLIFKIDRLKSGVLGTNNILEVEYNWLETNTWYVVNYYIKTLNIGVFELDQSIQTTAVLQETCFYKDTHCTTAQGVLVWKKESIKTCRFTEGQSSYCLYSVSDFDTHISCPELEISLHNISSIAACGGFIGTSSQGLYFTQMGGENIRDDIMTTNDFRAIATRPKTRRRRHAEKKFKNGLDARFNAKLQFFMEYISRFTTFEIMKLHYEVCKINQAQMRLIEHTAKTGNPSVIPNVLLGDGSYKAQLNGDVLSIWKCHDIKQYMFLRREKCTLEWPVKYMLKHEAKVGYVAPLSHIIVDLPTAMNEPCREFIFDTGKDTILLSNRSFVTNLPVLPRPGDYEAGGLKRPQISIESTGMYDVIENGNPEGAYELHKETQRSTLLLGEMEKKSVVRPDSTNAAKVLDSVMENIVSPIALASVFQYLGYGLIIILSIFVLGVGFQTGIVPAFIKILVGQVKAIFTGLLKIICSVGKTICIRKTGSSLEAAETQKADSKVATSLYSKARLALPAASAPTLADSFELCEIPPVPPRQKNK